MMADEELNTAPAYQRKFRWTKEGESLFIESVFLGLPIPPLFVATNIGFQWEVVDGLQRLSTLHHFMSDSDSSLDLVGRTEPLRLAGLEKLSQLNGRGYKDLPKNIQIYFGRQPLQVVSLTDKSDLQIRFDLFERLNKGGIVLTPQEVRACVYRGQFNDFIEPLAQFPDFASLLKLQQARQSDGTSVEQVLKFFAYKNDRDRFDGRVEKFLNRYMGEAEKAFNYDKERRLFESAAHELAAICGGPFLAGTHPLTPLVQFEACMVALGELIDGGVKVVAPASGWVNDPQLREASGAGTNTKSMLGRRIDRAKAIFSGQA
ncbi:hypothetical protein BN6_12310 [Saccharothrix espanaensis DSM 44229]|uniref:GmrSD restriction endonucleases N-terminal domain-containing protein n=2 Tax=Saccharothrix espanaensis TaxID=103731 RepID=K0JSS6_SACES|nr:hypothetical protein BN6_12310 [Saccharothrix espanaensis DSM 44229]